MNFFEILNALTADGVEFIIVGGVAARLHGSTRLTHDLDIVPKLDEESWKRLIDAIWNLNTRPRIPETKQRIENIENVRQWIVEKNMLALSFRSESGQAEIDLLVSESDNFEALKARAEQITVGQVVYFVAGIDDLIAMKRKAGRPQDILDIDILERIKEQCED